MLLRPLYQLGKRCSPQGANGDCLQGFPELAHMAAPYVHNAKVTVQLDEPPDCVVELEDYRPTWFLRLLPAVPKAADSVLPRATLCSGSMARRLSMTSPWLRFSIASRARTKLPKTAMPSCRYALPLRSRLTRKASSSSDSSSLTKEMSPLARASLPLASGPSTLPLFSA